jgi:hypothetical protein
LVEQFSGGSYDNLVPILAQIEKGIAQFSAKIFK